MRFASKTVAALVAAVLPAVAHAATLGGNHLGIQYDYREFYAASDHKPFRVELVGKPFADLSTGEFASRLLPVLQANKPPPNLTFTYDVPVERQHPDYRLMLVFDPANDLGSNSVCNGAKRLRPATPGRVYVFAVYCRNDLALSEVTGWTTAAVLDDPGVADLVKDIMNVVFDRSPFGARQHGHGSRR